MDPFFDFFWWLHSLSDIHFVLFAFAVIVLGLVLLVLNVSDSFLTWYGDSSFLKVSKTFKMNLFNFFDFMSVILFILFFSCFLLFIKSVFAGNDLKEVIVIFFGSLLIGFLPIFHFYKKYLFFKLNGDFEYTFNPVGKVLSINDIDKTEFAASDILGIDSYGIEGKIDFDFKVVRLKNGKEIIISSDLPFSNHLSEFFGEEVSGKYIRFNIFQAFGYFRWLKSFIK